MRDLPKRDSVDGLEPFRDTRADVGVPARRFMTWAP